MLGIQSETLKNILGHELTSTVKEWDSRNYLINNGDRLQNRLSTKSKGIWSTQLMKILLKN